MKTVTYFTKKLMLKANRIALHRGYNRVTPIGLIQNLPDSYKFPIDWALRHEHKAGQPCEWHMRVAVVVDEQGTKFCFDCDWNLYHSLPSVHLPTMEDSK
jgi:hypothetical protein